MCATSKTGPHLLPSVVFSGLVAFTRHLYTNQKQSPQPQQIQGAACRDIRQARLAGKAVSPPLLLHLNDGREENEAENVEGVLKYLPGLFHGSFLALSIDFCGFAEAWRPFVDDFADIGEYHALHEMWRACSHVGTLVEILALCWWASLFLVLAYVAQSK